MKTIFSNDLKARLSYASKNGSIIACAVLSELRSGKDISEIIRGTANYFSTKRKKSEYEDYITVRIVFTACTKNINHEKFPDRSNPQAPWFPENRTDLEPSTFIGYFKNLPEYSQHDIDFFISAICLNSKVNIKMYSHMNNIFDAYNGENYSPVTQYGETTLHHSCMRDEVVARNAADFYSNFAGAKIIIAKDSSNNILGRAIVWPNVIWEENEVEENVSVLDRIYYTHTFVLHKIYDFAKRNGIQLRKKINDFQHTRSFVTLNPIKKFGIDPATVLDDLRLKIKVPATNRHKKGAPYLDTFSEIYINKSSVELCNYYHEKNHIATCRHTSGIANRSKFICPNCGILHTTDKPPFCEVCKKKIYSGTVFGTTLVGKTINYKGQLYPSILFRKGHPISHMHLYLKLERIFDFN